MAIQISPIELPVSNMYADGRTIIYADGTAVLVRNIAEYVSRDPDEYYGVKIGDVITRIAYRYFKDKVDNPSHYWWIIADVNKIKNPLDLSSLVGMKILIPNILNFKLKN